MGRRTVSLDDGCLRFRYFGKFQCGIAVFYYFLCGFAVFGPSLRPPPPGIDVIYTKKRYDLDMSYTHKKRKQYKHG